MGCYRTDCDASTPHTTQTHTLHPTHGYTPWASCRMQTRIGGCPRSKHTSGLSRIVTMIPTPDLYPAPVLDINFELTNPIAELNLVVILISTPNRILLLVLILVLILIVTLSVTWP